MYLTPDMAAEARQSLNLSQAKAAKETGINRAYLSQFESGKRVLEDTLLETLSSYYESQGWQPTQEQAKASVEQLINSDKHPLNIADGFVVSDDAAEEFILEDLLDEYYKNAQEIESLLQDELDKGLLGFFNEERALRQSVRPLLLMARQFQIKQILHGHYEEHPRDVDIEDGSTLTTVGDFIEALIISACPDRIRPYLEEVLEEAS
jgi:transcriptional regulator with XRE-family HTH domain